MIVIITIIAIAKTILSPVLIGMELRIKLFSFSVFIILEEFWLISLATGSQVVYIRESFFFVSLGIHIQWFSFSCEYEDEKVSELIKEFVNDSWLIYEL